MAGLSCQYPKGILTCSLKMDICYDATLTRSPPEFAFELFFSYAAPATLMELRGNAGYIVPAACPLTKLWLPSSRLNSAAA